MRLSWQDAMNGGLTEYSSSIFNRLFWNYTQLAYFAIYPGPTAWISGVWQERPSDHWRRYRCIQEPGTGAPPRRARHPEPRHPDGRGRRVRDTPVRLRAYWRESVFRSFQPDRRSGDGPYPALAQRRSGRGGAGHRRPDGQNGERPGQ